MKKFAKICRSALLTGTLVLASVAGNAAWAAGEAISAVLSLVSIQTQQTSESGGDELYFDISVYDTHGNTQHQRLPEAPLSWPTEALSDINNLQLWQGELAADTAVTLMISLMERDVPPWNVDDIIGVLRVQLGNHKGELVYKVGALDQSEGTDALTTDASDVIAVPIHGENSQYQLILLIATQ